MHKCNWGLFTNAKLMYSLQIKIILKFIFKLDYVCKNTLFIYIYIVLFFPTFQKKNRKIEFNFHLATEATPNMKCLANEYFNPVTNVLLYIYIYIYYTEIEPP